MDSGLNIELCILHLVVHCWCRCNPYRKINLLWILWGAHSTIFVILQLRFLALFVKFMWLALMKQGYNYNTIVSRKVIMALETNKQKNRLRNKIAHSHIHIVLVVDLWCCLVVFVWILIELLLMFCNCP